MKITSVAIHNYRSIKHAEIDFEYPCQILLGINESGKTNILRAISLLDGQSKLTRKDLRLEHPDEDNVIENGYIDFKLEVNAHGLTSSIRSLEDQIFTKENRELSEIIDVYRNLTISPVLEAVYRIELPSDNRTFLLQAQNKTIPNYSNNKNLYKNTSDRSISVAMGDGKALTIPPHSLCYTTAKPQNTELKNITFEEAIFSDKPKLSEKDLPVCIFWKYSEKNILPESINIASFLSDPESCVPLLSMFELSGIHKDKIKSTLQFAEDSHLIRYEQLLRKVGHNATKHLHDSWPELVNISIEIKTNRDLFVISITDNLVMSDMANRSDGFKRFLSFLLQISAKIKTNQMRNVIILLDEPEAALHPEAARNLMQELLRIANQEIQILYSTHSIFMVDRYNIDRHFLVSRKNGLSTITRGGKSSIQEEEVLYAALGYSMFEIIKPKNVILEGWRDKKILNILCEHEKEVNPDFANFLKTTGITFADGVLDIRNVARFLELVDRPCLIISDGDQAGNNAKTSYTEHSESWGNWVTLKEIFHSTPIKVETGEDLISAKRIKESVNKWATKNAHFMLPPFDLNDPPTEFTMDSIKRWARSSAEVSKLKGKELESRVYSPIKTEIFSGLQFNDLNPGAIHLLNYIKSLDWSTV